MNCSKISILRSSLIIIGVWSFLIQSQLIANFVNIMKILLAPDKFKGSLSAQAVCLALEKGLSKTYPKATIIAKPLADGGDGSLEVLNHYFKLESIAKLVQDPLGRPITANYLMGDTTAYIELSAASGLVLLLPEERNGMYTSTFGTGQLMLDAIQKGAKTIFLFIGGSATTDGGMGIANALGYRFLDKNKNLLKPTGEQLLYIDQIDNSQLAFNMEDVNVQVICDVNNPLYGPDGAAYVYGTQKGSNQTEIAHLDQGLHNLAKVLKKHHFPDVAEVPGAGAAGGVGGGVMALLGANLNSGIQTFLEITQLEEEIKGCDFILTGEGNLDDSSAQGKVIGGVCQLANHHQKTVYAVCGNGDEAIAQKLGIKKLYTVMSRSKDFQEAMEKGVQKIEEIAQYIEFN